jgi:hypothetical protein
MDFSTIIYHILQCYRVQLQNLCYFNSETCEDFKTLLFCAKKIAISWECLRKCIFNMTVNQYVKSRTSTMLIYEIWFPWLINTQG